MCEKRPGDYARAIDEHDWDRLCRHGLLLEAKKQQLEARVAKLQASLDEKCADFEVVQHRLSQQTEDAEESAALHRAESRRAQTLLAQHIAHVDIHVLAIFDKAAHRFDIPDCNCLPKRFLIRSGILRTITLER